MTHHITAAVQHYQFEIQRDGQAIDRLTVPAKSVTAARSAVQAAHPGAHIILTSPRPRSPGCFSPSDH